MTEDFSLWHTAADGSTHCVVPSVYQVHPPKAGNLPTVVFFTGFGEQDIRSLRRSAVPFAKAGFSVIGLGIPLHTHSLETGEWLLNVGLADRLRSLAKQAGPLLLAGDSRGGTVALAAAAGMGKDCAGVIPLAPLGLINLTTIEYIGRLAKNYVLNLEFLSFQTFIVSLRIGGEIAGHLAQGGVRQALRFTMKQTDRTHTRKTTRYSPEYTVNAGRRGCSVQYLAAIRP